MKFWASRFEYKNDGSCNAIIFLLASAIKFFVRRKMLVSFNMQKLGCSIAISTMLIFFSPIIKVALRLLYLVWLEDETSVD